MRFVSSLCGSRTAAAGALLLGALVAFGCSEQATQPDATDGDVAAIEAQDLGPAFAAQKAHTDRLMAREGVVGTGVGLTDDGEPSVAVYTVAPGVENIPDHVDGVPVEKVVTGPFVAGSDPTTRRRPAPVGFSVGHPNITAGTYGARVQDGSGNVYMLSNNHILADINSASIGDPTLQPGPTDGGSDPGDRIAELADYEPIDFSNDNVMDAAISQALNPDSLSVSTPSDDGYGTPSSTPLTLDSDGDGNVDSGVVGTAVQKYGRTTGLTSGEVSEINVTTEVCYVCANPLCTQCSQSATMVDQIAVTPGDFSDGGDSGSLIVTNDGNNQPVALLFAGSDTRTLGNRIDLVLDRFAVSVDDGGDDGGDTNSAPTASFTSSCTDLTCDFDGSGSSDSDGSIASYEWDFGDGTTATGQTVSHTYDSGGTFTVTLTVTDDDGATDSSSQDVSVSSGNSAPTASFTSSCTDLTCDFDGSGSSDSDGSIASYEWDFGDGTTATGQTVSHTYDSGGTFTVTLTVTDDDGATDSSSQDVSVSSSTVGFHVGDLDGASSSQGSTWTATVTVTAHDGSHNAEEGSTVSFSFSGRDVSGTDSCTTGTDGTCSITVSNIRKRTGDVTFEVTDLSDADGNYDATANHDPDGDSDGTIITVSK